MAKEPFVRLNHPLKGTPVNPIPLLSRDARLLSFDAILMETRQPLPRPLPLKKSRDNFIYTRLLGEPELIYFARASSEIFAPLGVGKPLGKALENDGARNRWVVEHERCRWLCDVEELTWKILRSIDDTQVGTYKGRRSTNGPTLRKRLRATIVRGSRTDPIGSVDRPGRVN